VDLPIFSNFLTPSPSSWPALTHCTLSEGLFGPDESYRHRCKAEHVLMFSNVYGTPAKALLGTYPGFVAPRIVAVPHLCLSEILSAEDG
jgi:hypothetical protein